MRKKDQDEEETYKNVLNDDINKKNEFNID